MDPSIVLLLGLLVLVYLNVAGRRRAQRNRAALDQRLVPGAQVVTTSGLHGSVDEVDDDGTVLLEIAPGWVTRWEKAAVGRVVESPADELPETADETSDEAPEPTLESRPEPSRVPTLESSPEPARESTPGPTPEPGPRPGGEVSTDLTAEPTAEPGARRLPDTAPPDRA